MPLVGTGFAKAVIGLTETDSNLVHSAATYTFGSKRPL